MSRTTAILLLPIMMIFAIQPVIALHYCAGELQSLNLFAQHAATDISPIHAADHGNNHSCCNSHRTGNSGTNEDPRRIGTARHGHELHFAGDKCCNTEILELTTDDYQNKVEQPASRLLPLSFDTVGAILTRLYKLSDPITDIRTPHPDFPPEGLFLKDVSLLTYICIYRI
ncbi:hypothetical protein [Proteiniphilum acetatigenes]|uniref:hypothetical protein n=1 Tax=Proteiniphilum acetatigenes TaxID=294710 RepID=UPI00089A7941|nr:hypothetical protein [Proteiniphilum acetatigenes]SEA19690.1 hypothetical protein SAMN05216331_1258 [Porphyromonadaceae bacterium KH3R12]SFL55077.1 hypothetical protein SAMN05216357_12831 [Porphyromonadaceae bacterium KH3CP3RA]